MPPTPWWESALLVKKRKGAKSAIGKCVSEQQVLNIIRESRGDSDVATDKSHKPLDAELGSVSLENKERISKEMFF